VKYEPNGEKRENYFHFYKEDKIQKIKILLKNEDLQIKQSSAYDLLYLTG
jgi:hypothetical protein